MFILVKLIFGIEKWNCIKTIKSHRIHWLYLSSMFLVSCISVSNIWLIDTIFIMHISHQGRSSFGPNWVKKGWYRVRLFQGQKWPSWRISKRIVDRAIEITMMAVRMGLMFILFFTLLRYDIGKSEIHQSRDLWNIFWIIRLIIFEKNWDKAHFRKLIKSLNLIYEIIL